MKDLLPMQLSRALIAIDGSGISYGLTMLRRSVVGVGQGGVGSNLVDPVYLVAVCSYGSFLLEFLDTNPL